MKSLLLLLALIPLFLPATVLALGVTPPSLDLQEGERRQVIIHNTAPSSIRLAFHAPPGFVLNASSTLEPNGQESLMIRRTNESRAGVHSLTIYARFGNDTQESIITGGRVRINATSDASLATSYAAGTLQEPQKEKRHAHPLIGSILILCILASGIWTHQAGFLSLKNS